MALWRSLLGLVTGAGYRQPGQQGNEPGSRNVKTAMPVNIDTALQLSAVWACVKLITEAVGSVPVNMWKVDSKGVRTEKDVDHPIAKLLNGKVNRWQTRQEYFECLTYQLVMLGNNYSAVQRDNDKNIIALVPLMTNQMRVDLLKGGGIAYEYSDGTNVNAYSEETVWQNKLFGNGILGLSPLAFAANSIGIGQAAETQVSRLYSNGGKPSGLLTIDKVLTDVQRAAIKKNFSEMTEGNEERLFVLEAGMNYDKISLSPSDIQLLDSRRFQIEDIARFFGVPSILINDGQAATAWGSGIQQIMQGFYRLGLRPIFERYEASMKNRLLVPEERAKYEFEFDYRSLVEADLKDRISSGKEAVQGMLMTPNEWRKMEGMQPIPGGESLYGQQQMTPAEQLKDIKRDSGKTEAPDNADKAK